jgi:hypothetical protein
MNAERRRANMVRGNNWRHGTTYAWDIKKCDCETCLDHKVKFIREKNKRVTERRRAKRAEEMARAKAG